MKAKPIFNDVDRAVLSMLKKKDNITLAYLIREGRLAPVSAIQSMQRLVDKGIITKKQNPKNKTENLLSYGYDRLSIEELIGLLS